MRFFGSKNLVAQTAASTIHIWPPKSCFFNLLVKQTRSSGYGRS
nr:MAG TPA: hypothetical protein [Caudoviricetes sp.]